MAGQYPFADAQQSFGGLGNQASHIAYMLAQRKYAQQVQLERIAAMMEAQKARQRSADERINMETPYYNARANRENQMAGRVGDIRAAAQGAGDSFGNSISMPNPLALGEGPTREASSELDRQSHERMMMAQMLKGLMLANNPEPQRAMEFMTQNRAMQSAPMTQRLANAILTKTHSAVPVGHGGGVYDPTSGGMDAIMPQNVPAGGNLVTGEGDLLAKGQPKPLGPANQLPSLQALYGKLTAGGYPTDVNSPLYKDVTNALHQTISGMQMPADTSNQTPQISTKEDYDKLPSGSRYIGPDGKLATKR